MDNEEIKTQLINEFTKELNLVMVDLWRYGVKIDKIDHNDLDTNTVGTFFISVPKSSHLTLKSGEEASDITLAKYAKDTIRRSLAVNVNEFMLSTFGSTAQDLEEIQDQYKFKAKIRDEVWDREKEEIATLVAIEAAMRVMSKQNK